MPTFKENVMDEKSKDLEQESWEKGLGLLHDMSCQVQPDHEIPELSEKKIIVINCHGRIDEIITSLKEVISNMEEGLNHKSYQDFESGTQLHSKFGNAVVTVLK